MSKYMHALKIHKYTITKLIGQNIVFFLFHEETKYCIHISFVFCSHTCTYYSYKNTYTYIYALTSHEFVCVSSLKCSKHCLLDYSYEIMLYISIQC